MTPAEQIRAQVEWYVQCLKDVQAGKVVRGLGEAEAGYHSALAALDALLARLAACEQELAAALKLADKEAARAKGARDDLAAILDAPLETDRADKLVWLTRDEAKNIRGWLDDVYARDWIALLDERIGDKPTSIRAMIDKE
jgi:hypothetical protein